MIIIIIITMRPWLRSSSRRPPWRRSASARASVCVYIYIYIYVYIYIVYIYIENYTSSTCIYIYIYIYIYVERERDIHTSTYIYIYRRYDTPNPPTNIVDFRGFDSSIMLCFRGGILMSIEDLPESLTQAMLVGTVLVGELGVR